MIEVPSNDIMRTSGQEYAVSTNNVEMLVLAFSTQTHQAFADAKIGSTTDVYLSQAIRTPKLVYYARNKDESEVIAYWLVHEHDKSFETIITRNQDEDEDRFQGRLMNILRNQTNIPWFGKYYR